MNKEKGPYLPKVRSYYHKTDEECQTTNEGGSTEEVASPIEDDIVVNNIAYQEFEYTDDMISDEDLFE